jgi:DNA replication and repair protein RecF
MISSVRLQNFRSYDEASFEFEPGVNIIVGPNATGKTNLLESILVLGSGNSYKARDNELVGINKKWCRVEGFFDGQQRIVKIVNTAERTEKNIEIATKAYKRLSFNLKLPIVFFEPGDLQVITRGPQLRRDLIDGLLVKSRPEYKPLLNKYHRVLAQRNALLKHGAGYGQNQLFAWNLRLAELGAKVVEQRCTLIDQINKKISQTYSQVAAHSSSLKLNYQSVFSSDNYATNILKKLEADSKKDYALGFTMYGPHREDIKFFLNDRAVSLTASRGEIRSIVLSIKIFELELIENSRNQKPIMLLDDVFSELDGARRAALVQSLKDYQVIITTTDADSVIEHFTAGEQKLVTLPN